MIKAAIYARYSSDNQREESIQAQIRACKEYCLQHNYNVVKIYKDEAKSATTDNRPNFLKMIQEAKTGFFHVLVVHKLDRFARNRYDSAVYKRQLRQYNIRVESVLERIDDSPESVILESCLEGIAEYYSKNLAREVMKGMKENALKCQHTGGIPPLGYDVKDKKYIINEREADTVRRIFELYSQGLGYQKIIKILNNEGRKTKKGNNFGKNSLHDILKNEKYIGIYVFNRTASKEAGKRNHHKSKDEKDIIRIPGGMPQIIDENLFRKVKARMEKNKSFGERSRYHAKVTYLLSGLLECGECGCSMVGTSKTNKNKEKYYYYICNKKDRTKECNMRSISKNKLERIVLEKLYQYLLNKEELAEKIYAYYQNSDQQYKEEINYITEELKSLDKIIDNFTEAIAQGGWSKTLHEKLQIKEQEREIYLNRLKELESMNTKISKEGIKEYLKKVQAMLKNNDEDSKKHLINTFIEKVIVFKNKIEIYFKIECVFTPGGGGAFHDVTTHCL